LLEELKAKKKDKILSTNFQKKTIEKLKEKILLIKEKWKV